MKKNLLIDGNNLLYRTFFANNRSGEPDEVVIGLCIHSAITTMNMYFNQYKVDNIVLVFDSNSWRKVYTKDLSKCVTNKKYKAHRRDDKSPKERKMLQILDEHIDEFYDIIKNQTSIIALREPLLEGDDLIAAYIRMHKDEEHYVISSDKDMIQLLRYENVHVIDPIKNKERDLKEWNDDARLFLFEKCIRGESKTGDNVQSSYPRLRKDRLLKAYNDKYELQNVMNHTFEQTELDENGDAFTVTYTTKDLFKENILLMDLTAQPKKIKKLMAKAVIEGKENRGKYNHIKFLKFCSKNELENISKNIEQFVPMLTS